MKYTLPHCISYFLEYFQPYNKKANHGIKSKASATFH